jgi:hypothetical protein
LTPRVLTNRVDALTLAYRVKLSPAFVRALEDAQKRARSFGRVAFEYEVQAPTGDPIIDVAMARKRRIGPHRLRWASEWDYVRGVEKLWGELRWSDSQNRWLITNEPYYRIGINRHAPGGETMIRCGGCRGEGADLSTGEVCGVCDGKGLEAEPGWTIEVTWYAQALADFGLELALAESAALAGNCGEVFEARTRRIDLCADVEGWAIQAEDLDRIVKRPRAKCGREDDGVPTEGDLRIKRRTSKERAEDGARLHADGPHHRRRFTGFSVGRSGCIMSRVYDKRVELEQDTHGEKRAREEERWRAAGWDGESRVTRVEFQLRGVALKELGIQNPDVAVTPRFEHRPFTDKRGKKRSRPVLVGYDPIQVKGEDGSERTASLGDRLDSIWATCLQWVRLVEPGYSRKGNPLPASRLSDDPRWGLLRSVSFSDARTARPIKRVRDRKPASAAQMFGCMLSRAAREGMLAAFDEDRSRYPEDEAELERMLRRVVGKLASKSAEWIVEWLLQRGEGPAGALERFAARANAARAKFHDGVSVVDAEAKPPPEISAASAA